MNATTMTRIEDTGSIVEDYDGQHFMAYCETCGHYIGSDNRANGRSYQRVWTTVTGATRHGRIHARIVHLAT